jgi:invasion protein IalB
MKDLGPAIALAWLPISVAAQMPSSDLIGSVSPLPVIKSHADWRTACNATDCAAEPIVQVAPLSLVLTRDGDSEILVLRAPLGLLLAEGVAVEVDGRTLGRLAFLTCEDDGCVAPVRLEDSLGSALRGGRVLELTLVGRDSRIISARYSLMGFIAASTALAAVPEGSESTP